MASDNSVHRQDVSRLRALCAGDGRRLDLVEAAFEMAALQRDEVIDRGPFRQHVSAMASDVADLVHRRGAVPERLGEVIAQAYGYRGDTETYDDLQNADLPRVIERRKGLPVALSMIYLHVARAQGWDAEGLAFPGHFLIRVEIEGGRHVLDPFHGGAARDAAELRALLHQVLGADSELQPGHFDPVPDRDVLLRLENNVRLRLAKHKDWTGAARSLERMLAIAPDRPELLYESGEINARLDNRRAAIAAFERFLGLGPPQADAGLRQRASALLQELRRGLN
ncbi:Regulator of sirC expression, contains transglutaminase-like and TPR domains [Enhydrobacter aerosaccus]|uniref:Regulator of sirC expression, contains transglutaminase-like and TPR domains n=1 Tax=Enhydrobacter aerosaccus TaxID=225324 RepID=A0A1T4SHU4_9HYPH|nr:transglutaminase-like domain-containing protein [Enhydrobacter aerosaccus]SKA27757.1 Regulator of sirC expression, contains transglutaminase-like and TPR domains [Enhydrobacter aerosaccus]